MSGPFQSQNKIIESTRGGKYFAEYDANTVYYELSFGFPATKIFMVNDSDNYDAQFSWDGTTLHGQLKPGEDITLYANDATSIWVRVTNATGTNNIRVFAS